MEFFNVLRQCNCTNSSVIKCNRAFSAEFCKVDSNWTRIQKKCSLLTARRRDKMSLKKLSTIFILTVNIFL